MTFFRPVIIKAYCENVMETLFCFSMWADVTYSSENDTLYLHRWWADNILVIKEKNIAAVLDSKQRETSKNKLGFAE